MEEKKEIKVRLSTAISMVIILILIFALGVTYYFGFVADKKESVGDEKVINTTENVVSNVAKENETKKEEFVQTEVIPIEDKTMFKFFGNELFVGVLDNGKLFYRYEEDIDKSYESGSFSQGLKEYKGLDNIKRIKFGEFTSDAVIYPNIILITNDGTVYTSRTPGSGIKFEKYNSLKKYKVEDVISVNTGMGEEYNEKWELKLMDGSTKTVEVD